MTADSLSIQGALDAVAGWFAGWDAAKGNSGAARSGRATGPQQAAEPGSSVLSDDQVVSRLKASDRQGAKFTALYDRGDVGGYGGNRSRADFALAALMRWWCRNDAAQIERIMRRSALSRPKWDEGRPGGTYLSETIRHAIERSDGTVYEPRVRARFRGFDPNEVLSGVNGQHNGQHQAHPAPAADPPADTPPPVAPPSDGPPDDDREPPEPACGDAPDNPHRLAAAVLRSLPAGTLRFWRDQFCEWSAGAFAVVPDSGVRAVVTRVCREQFVLAFEREHADWEALGCPDGEQPAVRKVSVRLVGDVLNVLRSLVIVPGEVEPQAWLDGATGPDPRDVIATRNGLLHVPTGELLPHTPAFFTFNALDFDYRTDAPRPVCWEQFLLALWGDAEDPKSADMDSVLSLQEWMGYLLTADTSQQKMLMLIGPRRAGKGTIVRVVKDLTGRRNYTGPTLHSLTTEFGLQPLLNKSVAVIADARIGGRTDTQVVLERLLSITGEDTQTVNRKHLPQLDVKLTTRFVFVSNELPRLGDASGAFTGRCNILRLTRSFFGREDTALDAKLRAELPGILVWAIEGLKRLRARGRFLQPPAGAELLEDLEELNSPVGAFVRERCVLHPAARATVEELFAEWKAWCGRNGRDHPGNLQTFGKDLHAAVGGLKPLRTKTGGVRTRGYHGIRLRAFTDHEDGHGGEGP